MSIRTAILEPLFMERMHEIGPFVADSASMSVTADMFDRLTLQFKAQVLAGVTDRGVQVHEVKHPASWWQHLKYDHAPAWFTRRWPVRFESTKIRTDWKKFAAYPRADMHLPSRQFGYPITISMLDDPIVDSPFEVTRTHDERSKPAYQSRHALAYKLHSTAPIKSLEDHSMRFVQGPSVLHIRSSIEAVLDGLEELGVNPNELLRTGE